MTCHAGSCIFCEWRSRKLRSLGRGQVLEIDQMIRKFIWQGRKPRTKLAALELSVEDGGCALPHIRKNDYAACLD
ncbi:hypothetical protein NDU88_006240 [Pleurodeles waltl]|uniref:Uncharacterized protein n=1 Tax=Pleurodeles waltl TaxID=8319 RepID=A0AAV7LNZ6_PLEWA|nr:hypothetical protein NDU88_006240 [Pleurodeles waltl]